MKTLFLEMERLRNPYSGLGQFCTNLGRVLLSLKKNKNFEFIFYLPDNQKDTFGQSINSIAVSPWNKVFGIAQTFDIWHCMHQDSEYLPKNKETKLIITIHDLNFLERDDYSVFRKWFKIRQLQNKIKYCSAITYISNYTKNQVNEHLKIAPHIIERVIYNGNNIFDFEALKYDTRWSDFKEAPHQFIFSLGIIRPKKNFHVLLPILVANPTISWLLAGDDSHKYATLIREKAQAMGVLNRIYFLGKIQEKFKIWLYQNCQAFLFPSLAEGFGMPVIEAMAFGKPVFLSKLASLPEIGGEEAYYFEDFSEKTVIDTFTTGMENYTVDKSKPEKLKNHAVKFSWERAANEYLNLYEKLLEN